MNHTQRTDIMQRWTVIQYDLMPELKDEAGGPASKLEKLIPILEWVGIEEFVDRTRPSVTP